LGGKGKTGFVQTNIENAKTRDWGTVKMMPTRDSRWRGGGLECLECGSPPAGQASLAHHSCRGNQRDKGKEETQTVPLSRQGPHDLVAVINLLQKVKENTKKERSLQKGLGLMCRKNNWMTKGGCQCGERARDDPKKIKKSRGEQSKNCPKE